MTGAHNPIRYLRQAGVAGTEIEVETFLTEPGDHEVYHLDQTGSAVWRLLATPHSLAEVTEVFVEAFPDVPLDRLAADLEVVLTELCARNLAVQTDGPPGLAARGSSRADPPTSDHGAASDGGRA